MHTPCAVLYCHLYPVRIYHNFHTIFYRRYGFREKIYWKKNVLISSQNFGAAFLVLRRIRRAITINAQTASCKDTVIIIRLYETLIFTTDIHLSVRFLTAVAVFRKPNDIPLRFSIDLVLNFLLSWLLVLLPSTFFFDVLDDPIDN